MKNLTVTIFFIFMPTKMSLKLRNQATLPARYRFQSTQLLFHRLRTCPQVPQDGKENTTNSSSNHWKCNNKLMLEIPKKVAVKTRVIITPSIQPLTPNPDSPLILKIKIMISIIIFRTTKKCQQELLLENMSLLLSMSSSPCPLRHKPLLLLFVLPHMSTHLIWIIMVLEALLMPVRLAPCHLPSSTE